MELSPHLVWRLGAAVPLVAACMGCTLSTDLDGLAGDSTTSAASGAGGSDPQGAGGNVVAATSGPGPGPGAGGGGGGGDRGCTYDADYHTLVLNELAPDGEPDWIELKNCGVSPVPMCGVIVSQDYDGFTLQPGSYYAFAEDVVLEAGAWLVIHRDVDFPFGLSKDTVERFTLLGPASELLDETEWDLASLPFDTAHSWARVPDCQGAFMKTSPPSSGAAND